MNPSTQPPPALPRPPQYSQPPPPQQQQQQPEPQYEMYIVQQPERGKVVVKNKEKDRRPIDPPPIIQVTCRYDNSPCSYHHNPYLFCYVSLYDETEDTTKTQEGSTLPPLVGYTASSMHRLKDLSNSEGAFFVFGDLAATITGKARLHFSLYEVKPGQGYNLLHKTITSNVMDVQSSRDWEGTKESTMLSRSFSEQGVKLRLRKESRAAHRRSAVMPGAVSHMPPMPGPSPGHVHGVRSLPPIQGPFDDDGSGTPASNTSTIPYHPQHFSGQPMPSAQAYGYPSSYGMPYSSTPGYPPSAGYGAPQGHYYSQYPRMSGYPPQHQQQGTPPQQQQQPGSSSQQQPQSGYPPAGQYGGRGSYYQ